MSGKTTYVVFAVGLVVLGAAGLFVVDAESSPPEPAHFDDTVTMGLSIEDEHELEHERDVELPRVQVFYSQYRYVVGYHGVERFAAELDRDGHEERFGYPLAVYVSDYSATELTVTEEGYPEVQDGWTRWTDATAAYYVVDSEAQSPAGETAIPFSESDSAVAFAEEHDGVVVTWEEVIEQSFEIDDAGTVRERVESQHDDANETVADTRPLLERPESVVVGEDAETIQEAIDRAPAETTVVVPEGTYEETVEINRSMTLRGEGDATIRGDGNSSVIRVEADRAAVTGLELTGVGDTHQPSPDEVGTDEEAWDEDIELAYGYGDAGVKFVDSTGALVEDVTVETPANGVLLRDSPDTVVRNVSVSGTDSWRDGFMGVMTMRSAAVIEESTFEAGRDGVYSHRSNGLVIRDNVMTDGRFGVHYMHTSDSLVADNEVRDQAFAGIIVMTGPERNAIVGNDVRESTDGIRMGGSDSYVADNVVVDNDLGFTTGASTSIYEGNVAAGNEIGVHASSVLPSNHVMDNAFIANDRPATASSGPLVIWAEDGSGNYWDGAIGEVDGDVLDRSYSPTDPVDRRLHYADGSPTIAQSPALDAIRGLEGTVSGLRAGSIVDPAPLCDPPHPDRVPEQWSHDDETICPPEDTHD
ncbi:NosD domain-containing protein [Natrialbaceae archaeon AArc-T1-2]|uniref:NosD domain-containing protein n=1 Tax=Natrialbaceae archaeon AArc-T1-2 TaxID=3053904 RepID=UPI00255A826C|nr:NosD domain-containing protein [Natrialbaceae archaeon AArc-T1-2]WIV67247.1 NosD domain-containing protein [Natrialbaceae archaeon AArc-T1-2]